jgi:hypothetical protein
MNVGMIPGEWIEDEVGDVEGRDARLLSATRSVR